ncbi:DUF3048 domain-containing protein [Peribacillus kribbensis]|uniref:DUF3048 domain-containing protein n=1 Tax=Peribacillus kribbensis TaxID=356658 RepID=UPI000410945D|nr:DUF3048 domain-containing protein [Peribacillus kribbensis]
MALKAGAICLAACLLFAGCSQTDKKADLPPKTVEKHQEQKVHKESNQNVFPLTGLKTNQPVNRRAVAVMINNHPKARPQSGISKADLVYELLAEGEVTRLLAVFQSERPDTLGPVRSARDYYMELAKGLNALYILHGYSPEAKKMLADGYIDHLNGLQYDGTLFKRASFRKAPHNSYITYDNIEKGARENGFKLDTPPQPLTFLTAEELQHFNGEKAGSVEINYSTPDYKTRYVFDQETKKYKRYSDSVLTIDYDTKEEVLLDNLLIIEAPHRVVDKKGRRDIDLRAGGKGFLFQLGRVHEITWEFKKNVITPYIGGKEAGLIPGRTWVSVIPVQTKNPSKVSIKP